MSNYLPWERRVEILRRLTTLEPVRSIARAVGCHKDTVMALRRELGHGAELLLARHGDDTECWEGVHDDIADEPRFRDSWGRRLGFKSVPRTPRGLAGGVAIVAVWHIWCQNPDPEEWAGTPAMEHGYTDHQWTIEELEQALAAALAGQISAPSGMRQLSDHGRLAESITPSTLRAELPERMT